MPVTHLATQLTATYTRCIAELQPRSTVIGSEVLPKLPTITIVGAAGAVAMEMTPKTHLLGGSYHKHDLQMLLELGRPAPFGWGSDTVVGESFRLCKEVPASQVTFSACGPRASSWETIIRGMVVTVAATLTPGEDLDFEFYKLLCYQPGGLFDTHADTQRGENHIGTLVVTLPTAHAGGELALEFGDAQSIYRSSECEQVSFCGFLADVQHRVARVTDGIMLRLTYNLHRRQSPALLPETPAGPRSAATSFVSAITRALLMPNTVISTDPDDLAEDYASKDRLRGNALALRIPAGSGQVGVWPEPGGRSYTGRYENCSPAWEGGPCPSAWQGCAASDSRLESKSRPWGGNFIGMSLEHPYTANVCTPEHLKGRDRQMYRLLAQRGLRVDICRVSFHSFGDDEVFDRTGARAVLEAQENASYVESDEDEWGGYPEEERTVENCKAEGVRPKRREQLAYEMLDFVVEHNPDWCRMARGSAIALCMANRRAATTVPVLPDLVLRLILEMLLASAPSSSAWDGLFCAERHFLPLPVNDHDAAWYDWQIETEMKDGCWETHCNMYRLYGFIVSLDPSGALPY